MCADTSGQAAVGRKRPRTCRSVYGSREVCAFKLRIHSGVVTQPQRTQRSSFRRCSGTPSPACRATRRMAATETPPSAARGAPASRASCPRCSPRPGRSRSLHMLQRQTWQTRRWRPLRWQNSAPCLSTCPSRLPSTAAALHSTGAVPASCDWTTDSLGLLWCLTDSDVSCRNPGASPFRT
jgi:hypothetical protein